MDTRFKKMSYEYMNTGGGCMVGITTVYDLTARKTLYVYVNEEGLTISNFDWIREELPDSDMEHTDFVQFDVDESYISRKPDPQNQFAKLSAEEQQLIWDCWVEYLQYDCKRFGYTKSFYVDCLPPVLYDKMPAGYEEWLNVNDKLVETNGYDIIVDDYFDLDPDGENAAALKKHLSDLMAKTVDSDEEWDNFVCTPISLKVGDKEFEFSMCAAVYNALMELAETIIAEQ